MTTKKRYKPPVLLLKRLKHVALRLEGYLTGSPRNWKMPIYTSKFSLAYQKGIEEKSDVEKKLTAAHQEEKNVRKRK